MKKAKCYQDGGIINPNAIQLPGIPGQSPSNSTYPFQSSGVSMPSGSDSGLNQTFNIQPSAQAGQPQQMKRGGKVKSASKRADGCAIRGKTRA